MFAVRRDVRKYCRRCAPPCSWPAKKSARILTEATRAPASR